MANLQSEASQLGVKETAAPKPLSNFPSTPAEFSACIDKEAATYERIVKDAKIQID